MGATNRIVTAESARDLVKYGNKTLTTILHCIKDLAEEGTTFMKFTLSDSDLDYIDRLKNNLIELGFKVNVAHDTIPEDIGSGKSQYTYNHTEYTFLIYW